jgi:sulfur carrier protein
MISISLNNEIRHCCVDRPLADLLLEWDFEANKFAIAINGDFVPRSQYGARYLAADDKVDVLAPVQGG